MATATKHCCNKCARIAKTGEGWTPCKGCNRCFDLALLYTPELDE